MRGDEIPNQGRGCEDKGKRKLRLLYILKKNHYQKNVGFFHGKVITKTLKGNIRWVFYYHHLE